MAGSRVGSAALQGKSVPRALPGIAKNAALDLATAKLGSMAKGAGGIPKGRLQIPGLPPGVNINGFTSGAANAAQTGAANMAGGGGGIYGMLGGMVNRAANAKRATPSLFSRVRDVAGNAARTAVTGGGGEEEERAPRTGINRWLGPIGDLFKRPGALEAGASLAGGYLEGKAAGKIADEDRKWDREKFGRTQGLDEGAAAVGLGRELSMAPMRDQAMFMLQQRMGLSPGAFKPRDMFNESTSAETPQLGGVDLEEWKRRNAGYKPGAGGLNTDIQRLLLQKLGYGGAGNA